MTELRKTYPTDKDSGVSLRLESDGAVPVVIQDQTSPVLIVPMNKTENTTTLTAPTAIEDYVIAVTSVTGFVPGVFVSLANVAANRYYTAEMISKDGGLNVTLDTPIDFAFPVAGTVVTQGTHDLNVNGAVTPQIFSLRASDPGLPVVIDVTRVILRMITATAVDLEKFGDIVVGATFRGIVFRKVDGVTVNIGSSLKTNGDIAGVMFDWTPYAATNPVQGVDGFVARMTFAGQNKMGVAVRVAQAEDFQVIIQDDLTSITSFKIMIEGHVVVD